MSKPTFGKDQTVSATAVSKKFSATVAERISKGDADPARRGVSLKDAMGEAEYREYQKIDADFVSDEELFE